uniref:uncharacterized protein LOC108588271 isoform X2 n=1 Tax=Callithrix jacchus TaxID=9483 RepID=UPI0023DD2216|nr:uncharacterized protein LOC108588271 isoform X2 [Callithrix jacchus]
MPAETHALGAKWLLYLTTMKTGVGRVLLDAVEQGHLISESQACTWPHSRSLSRDVSPHSLCCNKKPLGSISVPLCTSVIVLLTVCWIYHERHQSSGGDWASCYSGLPFVHTGVSKTICLVMSASEDATSVLLWTFSPQFLPHDGLFRLFSCVLMDTQVSSPLMVAFSAVHVHYNGLFLIQLYMSLILNCI